ncbi:hypothetical protein EUGRSUZ_G03182 [Eucalyptus grandis]|uniref:Uncharacterized protein n=2 Tax=Eucalyptus grandis TaxID=71139 RepID=A0ACC3K927_EUCGR|nr:hypothetical protein EUGRSUZ_G03182 [Eucalyptus grandis]
MLLVYYGTFQENDRLAARKRRLPNLTETGKAGKKRDRFVERVCENRDERRQKYQSEVWTWKEGRLWESKSPCVSFSLFYKFRVERTGVPNCERMM